MDNVDKRLAGARIETEFTSASDPESFKKMHCGPEQFARSSDSAVVVVVDDLAFEFDDPDLDLDKLSEALGSPATPVEGVLRRGFRLGSHHVGLSPRGDELVHRGRRGSTL